VLDMVFMGHSPLFIIDDIVDGAPVGGFGCISLSCSAVARVALMAACRVDLCRFSELLDVSIT